MDSEDVPARRTGDTGLVQEAAERYNERWTDDLRLTATFHRYGSTFYDYQGIRTEAAADWVKSCEAAILDEIGASAREVRLADAVWAGRPYRDGEGVLCRDARIRGSRLVADRLVTYRRDIGEETAPDRSASDFAEGDAAAGPESGENAFLEEVSGRLRAWMRRYWRWSFGMGWIILLLSGLWLLKKKAGELDRRREER